VKGQFRQFITLRNCLFYYIELNKLQNAHNFRELDQHTEYYLNYTEYYLNITYNVYIIYNILNNSLYSH